MAGVRLVLEPLDWPSEEKPPDVLALAPPFVVSRDALAWRIRVDAMLSAQVMRPGPLCIVTGI